MDTEQNKTPAPAAAGEQDKRAPQTDGSDQRVQNPEQKNLDQIEGRMNNGETGGVTKAEGKEQ